MSPVDGRRRFLLESIALSASAAALSRPSAALAGSAQSEGPENTLLSAIEAGERILDIVLTPSEREQIARSFDAQRGMLAAIRAAGPLPGALAPASVVRARLPGRDSAPATPAASPLPIPEPGPLPDDDLRIAFAPVALLAGWLRSRAITSRRLVQLSLDRIERLDPILRCVITVTRDRALREADAADAELAAGRWRGPLHGVPYGLKDIVDTAGIATTFGAEPWRDRVPDGDAWITRRLADAGAVLVAKTSVGALAYGDIWFGGTTKSPWNPERGSSGSSAGSASGVAAGCFPFAIGSETLGSIVSPSDRCGTAGLRPTFGRVARTGTMALVWSMDKLGPIARTVEDCALVLDAINGADPGDPSSVDEPLRWGGAESPKGLRVGVDPAWLAGGPMVGLLRAAIAAAEAEGCAIVEHPTPAIDPSPGLVVLFCEAAAAFDELTRSDRDDELAWQADEAWPNTFRRTRFISAVDLVQADRLRRRTMEAMHDYFAAVDCVLCPPFASGLLVHTNLSGHPCALFRAGFVDEEPRGLAVLGRVFDEGTIVRVAAAIERRLGAWERRPPVA